MRKPHLFHLCWVHWLLMLSTTAGAMLLALMKIMRSSPIGQSTMPLLCCRTALSFTGVYYHSIQV